MAGIAFLVIIPLCVGILYWYYWPSSLLLSMWARGPLHGKTTGLFFISCGLQFAIGIAGQFVSFVGVFPRIGPLLLGLSLLALTLGGIVGWLVLLVKRWNSKAEREAYRKRHPLPKMQFTMPDVYTAVFYFAGAMALLTLLINAAAGSSEEYLLVVLGCYLFVATSLGFYIALDVLRYMTTKTSLWARAGIVLFCVFFSTMWILVGLLIAWRAWQRALLVTGMERDRKAREKEKQDGSGETEASKPVVTSSEPPTPRPA